MAEYKIGDKLICKAVGDFKGKLVVLEYQNTYGNGYTLHFLGH